MTAKIFESRVAQKGLNRLSREVIREYELWARLVEEHGSSILRKFKGYHDEKLKGEMQGFRSSRLTLKWRVVYGTAKENGIEIVNVERISPHDYRSR